jgi:hypothetical protein
MNRSARAIEQLGMPYGTAQGRLRKVVLFSLLCKHKENICFRCQKSIETVDELSLEHKEPWEGRDTSLFWSLDNIAFSHMKCNVPHVRHGGEGRRKSGPAGTAWCAYHEKFESIDNFYPDPERWNGVRHQCKTGRYERVPKPD